MTKRWAIEARLVAVTNSCRSLSHESSTLAAPVGEPAGLIDQGSRVASRTSPIRARSLPLSGKAIVTFCAGG